MQPNETDNSPSPSTANSGGGAVDWRSAMEENWAWIRTVVRSRLPGENETDDVMQEVAVAVLDQQKRPAKLEKVQPWLYRIAVRATINHFRRSGRQRRLIDNASRWLADETSQIATPREWVMQKEQTETVAEAVSQLPSGQRTILMLKYTQQWTYQQLADHLGVSVKTIEYRLAKARQRLRQILKNKGIDKPDR